MNEHLLRGPEDPLAAVAALTALFDQYVVYERDSIWHVAGDPVGEIVIRPGVVETAYRTDPSRPEMSGTAIEWSGSPWRALGDALAACPVPDWQAFGWATFETATGGVAPGAALIHLMIPAVRLRVTPGRVEVCCADPGRVAAVTDVLSRPLPPAPRSVADAIDVRSDRRYQDAVAKAVAQIRSGALDKVILSRVVDVPFAVDLVATYRNGRVANTPARSFLLDLGGRRAAGFSPETVVEVDPTGVVTTQPLAGTRALTGDAVRDGELRTELCSDAKEVYEHATSVKLAFEELAGLGTASGPRVTEFLAVKERGSVQHLASRVETDLPVGASGWDALAAVFPAVTASGIPKAAAYQLIRELEDESRGMYAGAVLMAGADGGLDAALVLRSVYQQGERTWLRAGAGIVAASQPEREFEETCEKLGSVAPYLVPARPVVPDDRAEVQTGVAV
ncbi:salicylate synthase [Kribbella sandramycini]|uniref:Salicylate synthase n=1 Tax=Kribbella sandramycini TaxID=60450 RepID=A0A7Y4KZ52_9ACTN|nr:salicylate synthase [Kribbella sandramycini]MBB6569657.1 salicylate synthetase [Kribbella sandramycini]NOL40511.1 salicylate synthase [Kribbella sandramycini]